MRFLIIHLSDIHFKKEKNSILEKEEQLFNVIRNSTKEFSKIFLIVSGDSAFSGLDEEYNIAKLFLENLKRKIIEYSGKEVLIITIPGNHDCNFSIDSKARQNQINIVQRLGDSAIDESVVNQCAEIQNDYFEFASNFLDESTILYKSSLLNILNFQLEDKTVLFYCYNTAYISELKEQPGKLFFPTSLISPDVLSLKADLIISLFHHPFNWLSPINRRDFATLIHESSDFYLTGHEHEFSKSMIDDLDDNVVYHIEGAVLQDSEDVFNSGFNLIGFDLSKQTFKSKNLFWDEGIYKLSEGGAEWVDYKRGKNKIKSKYSISSNFRRFLDDIGGNFSHPAKSDIKLSDLYVFPKLRFFNSVETTTESVSFVYEDSESIFKNFESGNKILLFGEESIGKTSLLKTTFSILNQRSYVPIYIEGHTIKSSNIDDFKKNVRNAFINQYNSDFLDLFEQEDLKKVVILIDDFDKSSIKSQKAKGNLLKNLIAYYDNIILVGNELIAIEEILSDQLTSVDLYSTFKQYELLEFNATKRFALIYKWYSLGNNEESEDGEIWRKCDKATKAINIAMGNKLVPNYPLFLLILLQSIETTNTHDLKISSYGNYFQLLILKALTDKIKDQSELSMFQNYASEFAHYLFEKKVNSVNIETFISFHNEITDFDHLDLPLLSYEKALKTLSEVNILESFEDVIEFKYKYTYYYFEAQFLSKNIRKEKVKEDIIEICNKLYRTEYANVLMFLIQFSNDEFILDQIISNAQKLFSKLEPCRLENDISHIHSLVTELPKLYLKNKPVKENREDENRKIDQVEENSSKKKDEIVIEIEDDETEIEVVAKLNTSFKLIEIIGQILKNNHGSINGKIKHALLKETYLLGLRTLNIFFSIINGNTDFVLNQLKSIVQSHDKELDETKIEKLTKGILFSICSQISLIFIKKIGDSIGSNKLIDKYPKIYSELPFTSVELTNFLIKLDYESSFPHSELSKLKSDAEKHTLSYYVLKRMVIAHLHRHEVGYKDRQRICSFLGIPIESQIAIEAKKKIERV